MFEGGAKTSRRMNISKFLEMKLREKDSEGRGGYTWSEGTGVTTIAEESQSSILGSQPQSAPTLLSPLPLRGAPYHPPPSNGTFAKCEASQTGIMGCGNEELISSLNALNTTMKQMTARFNGLEAAMVETTTEIKALKSQLLEVKPCSFAVCDNAYSPGGGEGLEIANGGGGQRRGDREREGTTVTEDYSEEISLEEYHALKRRRDEGGRVPRLESEPSNTNTIFIDEKWTCPEDIK